MKITNSDNCTLCHNSSETLIHLFCQCEIITNFWKDIEHWLTQKINFAHPFSNIEKIFGYIYYDENYYGANLIILSAKNDIFWCSRNNKQPNIMTFQTRVKKSYLEQTHIAQKNNRIDKFQHSYGGWHALLKEQT